VGKFPVITSAREAIMEKRPNKYSVSSPRTAVHSATTSYHPVTSAAHAVNGQSGVGLGEWRALLWGAIAASSLVLGALPGLARQWHDGLIGLVLGFGAGALISSISFELAAEGRREDRTGGRARIRRRRWPVRNLLRRSISPRVSGAGRLMIVRCAPLRWCLPGTRPLVLDF
jgi:hypothetical protein